MKTIAVDISQVVYVGSGSARYVNYFIDCLLQDKTNHYIFFCSHLRSKVSQELINKIQGNGATYISIKLPPTIFELLGNWLKIIPIERLLNTNIDLYISSDWVQFPTRAKKLTIIHDVIFRIYPEVFPQKILKVQSRRLRNIMDQNVEIIVDSLATKKDLLRFYPQTMKDKIHLLYPPVQKLIISNEQIEKTKAKYGIKKPFILSVGKIEPRKNLNNLIVAFNSIRGENIELLIVGTRGWEKERGQELNNNIRYLGFVDDFDLASLYSSAEMFVMPSLYEGFGYPVVEAMSYGCVVACSNNSSLGEIVGDAGVTFDPKNVDDIKSALEKLLNNQKLKSEIISNAHKRVELFNQDAFQKKLLKIISDIF